METVLKTTVNQIGRREEAGIVSIPLLSIGAALTNTGSVRSESNKLHEYRKNDDMVLSA